MLGAMVPAGFGSFSLGVSYRDAMELTANEIDDLLEIRAQMVAEIGAKAKVK